MAYVASGNSAVAYEQMEMVRTANIVGFFRKKEALSASKAVAIEDLDWMEMGVPIITSIWFNRDAYFKQHGITVTDMGKYWLDVDALKAFQERLAKMNSIIMWIALGFLAICVIISIGMIFSASALSHSYSSYR